MISYLWLFLVSWQYLGYLECPKIVILSQLEIVKDVTLPKKILRLSLIQTRQCCVGVGGNFILFEIRCQRNIIIIYFYNF